MANNDWDVTKPIDHSKIGDLPSAIRDVGSSTKVLLTKEHETPGTDNAGGQHRTGSARVYLVSGLPALDPEGNNLETNASGDDGRIAANTAESNELRVYLATSAGISTGWEHVRVGRVKAATEIDANGRGVVNVASGTISGQAVHVGQVDITPLTGQLKLVEPATGAMVAVAVLDPPTEDGHISSKKYTDTKTGGAAAVTQDSLSDDFLKDHAYQVPTAGFVSVYTVADTVTAIAGWIDTDDNPVVGGQRVAMSELAGGAGKPFLEFFVPNGQYFEVTAGVADGNLRIYWTPLVVGGSAPVDQD